MSEHDSFEDRLRAMAEEIGRSVQRISELDMDQLAESYGVDPERARTFADAAGRWLSERLSGGEPLFGDSEHPKAGGAASQTVEDEHPKVGPRAAPAPTAGPHPLDLPLERQGLALSGLDSGRWTVRPGSNQLAGTGEGPSPTDARDIVGELRARDWITADGTLTLVGRHALARWCRAAEGSAGPGPEPDIARA